MNKWIKIFLALCVLLITAYLFMFQEDYKQQEFQFQLESDVLSGVLISPQKKDVQYEHPPLVIFVHGDGALTRDAFSYYKPIWNELTKRGIACLSLDKKGVGQSTGNWLNQSMEDRAKETIATIEYAKSNLGFNNSAIGLIGFSQAGWVMPKVATLSDYPDFIINISPAINWKRQSNFLTQRRLEREGADLNKIEMELNYNKEDFNILNKTYTYAQYVSYQNQKCEERKQSPCSLIDEDRYYFIQKNVESDAVQDIQNINCPTLVLFGSDDLNVDYKESYENYNKILSSNIQNQYKLTVYPNATHGLLKSKHFNYPNPGLFFLLKFWLFKKNAFAKDVLNDIGTFANENADQIK